MFCRCTSCGWTGDLAGVTKPGAKLRERPCPACEQPRLTRIKKSHNWREHVREGARRMVYEAAKTGKLPDGSPLGERTLLEQMAGLEAGPAIAGGHYARFVKSPTKQDALDDLRATAVMGLALQKKQTRAAAIAAKATKRELRAIASAAAASAEVLRAGVDMLAEVKGALLQIYAGTDCCVRLLAQLRDAAAIAGSPVARKFFPQGIGLQGPKALQDYLAANDAEPGALAADLSGFIEPIRERPEVGDVITFESGATWTVRGLASGVVMVAHCADYESAEHEKAVTRDEWRGAVDEAHQIARPGSIALDRRAAPKCQRPDLFPSGHCIAEPESGALDSHARRVMAESPKPGDVIIEHDGERFRVQSVTQLSGGSFRVHWSGPTDEGWSNAELWARKVAKAQGVLPADVTGDADQKPAEVSP